MKRIRDTSQAATTSTLELISLLMNLSTHEKSQSKDIIFFISLSLLMQKKKEIISFLPTLIDIEQITF